MIENLDKAWGVEQIVVKKPVTFLLADNMQFLRWCKDELMRGYWHHAIVDPPYGINVGKLNMGTRAADRTDDWKAQNRKDWDSSVPTAEYWELIKYVSRNQIVWGGNYFVNHLTPGRCFYVWDKKNNGMSFADCEIALTTYDKNARIIPRSRNLKNYEDVVKRHPTQKPVYVYDYLHLAHVGRMERVIDTHGGSFSHAVAAFKNNVELTIMDAEKQYFDKGIDSYEKATIRGRLAF